MKKTWKQILAAGCALSMLLTVPGMPVLGAEGYDEEITFAEEILNDESQEFDAVEAEIIDESQMNGVEADSQISEEALSGAKSLQNDLIVGRVENNYLSLSFDREEQFQERINLSNYGETTIKGLKVTLKNAKHVQLDLSQMETLTNGFNLGKNEDYEVFLMPDGRGDISGTLSISASGYSVWNITLEGYSDYDTYHEFRMVKYVPSSYVLKASSGDVTGIEGKLPQGVTYIAASKELYGAPMEKGTFVVNLVTSKGTKEQAALYVLENEDYNVANSAGGKYMGFDMPGAEEVGMNVFAFMSAETDQVFISGGEYKYLTNVWLNGKILTKGADYTVADKDGKTKITLKSSVLKNKTSTIKQEDLIGFENGDFYDEAPKYANTICSEFNTNSSGTSRGVYMKITPYNFYVVGKARSVVNSGFSDVQDPNHAYYKAIYWAADEGITKGYSDGTFGINKSCTRGEMIMFLWRYAGKPAPKTVSKSPFKDVAKTHAFYKAILWASQKGITKGYPDGTFGINRNVSRGECMMFLWRVKGKPAPKAVAKSPFKDVATTNAFYKAILWGYQNKITTGYTSGAKKGTFGINENCTRGQIVTFLYRAK